MKPNRLSFLGIPALVIAVLVAGCDGSSGSPRPSASTQATSPVVAPTTSVVASTSVVRHGGNPGAAAQASAAARAAAIAQARARIAARARAQKAAELAAQRAAARARQQAAAQARARAAAQAAARRRAQQQQQQANCTPGYSPCIAPGPDVDCAGGSGNGPRYVEGPVEVTGSDPYGLDSDGDGVGCES